jgi:putative SOS response-associated peptidase YedK
VQPPLRDASCEDALPVPRERHRTQAIEAKPAIFPGNVAPVVRKSEDGERELVNLNWGFVMMQKGLVPRPRRQDSPQQVLATILRRRRCLMPASSYCERKK